MIKIEELDHVSDKVCSETDKSMSDVLILYTSPLTTQSKQKWAILNRRYCQSLLEKPNS